MPRFDTGAAALYYPNVVPYVFVSVMRSSLARFWIAVTLVLALVAATANCGCARARGAALGTLAMHGMRGPGMSAGCTAACCGHCGTSRMKPMGAGAAGNMPCRGTCRAHQRRPVLDRTDRGTDTIFTCGALPHHAVTLLPFAKPSVGGVQTAKPFAISKIILSSTSALPLRLHCSLLL